MDLITAIPNVGFPIAVAVYVLVRMENRMSAVSTSNAKLAEAINGLIQVVSYCNQREPQPPRVRREYYHVRRVASDTAD